MPLPVIGEAPRPLLGSPLVGNQRTLEILERRRKARHSHRRGWLVRRMLLLADLLGFAGAFLIIEAVYGAGSGAANTLRPGVELAVLMATLPGWIVLAHLYGLYEQD